jgi:hypothetical protein
MPTPDFTAFPIPTLLLEQGLVTATGSTTTRTLATRFGEQVNVKDFGAVGDGIADDTAAIQAAIDYAGANNKQSIYMPGGTYKTTSPLYLDPPYIPPGLPGGLRQNLSNPANYQFSLSLIGEVGQGNQNNFGTFIRPTFKNDVVLYVGPGQGMTVANLKIIGQSISFDWRGKQDPNGVGIGLTGTGGGSSRAWIENCEVYGLYTGFKTAANGNGTLCDSNTFVKCFTGNVYYGFWIAGTQNYINSFYDCNPNEATVCLFNGFSSGCRVFGGNWSNNNSLSACFNLTSIQPVTATADGNDFLYSFIATVVSPDVFVGNVYNSYAIKTAHFGIIPLTLSAYNSGTGVGTFQMLPVWCHQFFSQFNAVTGTDLSAEVQVVPRVYCAERVTTFWGNGIQVYGAHSENAYAPMTLIRAGEGFGGKNPSTLNAIQFNVNPSLFDLRASPDPSDNIAKYYIQQSWPFIWLDATASNVTIQGSQLGQYINGFDPVIVDVESGEDGRLIMRENAQFGPINIRRGVRSQNETDLGRGEYDVTPFTSYPNKFNSGDILRAREPGKAPTWGYRPAPWSRPLITRDNLENTLAVSPLPTIAYSGGNWHVDYPILLGNQIYTVADNWFNGVAQSATEIVSNHQFYTYGQDLTTTNVPSLSWNYKGAGFAVYANDRTLELMFPGLGIKLFDGATDVFYYVTGVYSGLGYFTVGRGYNINAGNLSGNKTTVFTGATIKSQPLAIQIVSGAAKAVTKTADFTVGLLENFIIVNKGSTCTVTLPSAALYNGRTIKIKTIQAFTVVSASANVIPLIGGAAATAILAATAGKWAELTANGTTWEIIQSN